MDTETCNRLRRVVVRLARELNADAAIETLTPSQASVLGQIVAHGPLTIGELGRLEGLNPTMLSRVVGKLEQAGLISRMPNPDDLRSAQVASTRDGAGLSERIRSRRAATLSDSMSTLPAAQVQAVIAALPALEALALDLQERRTAD